jgi:hypothetical protein
MRPRRERLAVQVVQDAAAFRGDHSQCRGQLDGCEGSHLQDPHQGHRDEYGGYFHGRHDHRHLLVVGDDQSRGDREHGFRATSLGRWSLAARRPASIVARMPDLPSFPSGRIEPA